MDEPKTGKSVSLMQWAIAACLVQSLTDKLQGFLREVFLV